MNATVRLSYYHGITQSKTPEEVKDAVTAFAEVITANGGPQISVLPVVEIPQQIAMIVGGQSEIALMNPLGYLFAHRQQNAVIPIAIAIRTTSGGTGPTYLSQVYANIASGINDVAGIRGRSLGFGLAVSTSNFLVPAAELRRRGVHPLTGPQKITFLGRHDQVAQAVYDGTVDAGAGHDGVLDDLTKKHPDAPQKVQRLFWSDPIPSDPVATSVVEPALSQLRSAVVAAGKDPKGKAAIATFWGTPSGLDAVDASAYEPLSGYLDALNLRMQDILPP